MSKLNQLITDQDNQLKQLYESGKTLLEIASILNMTRNQVAGRLYRRDILSRKCKDFSTTFDRLQSLHDKMDLILQQQTIP